ncbi:hypothetical protein BHM03_00023508 [Ensete ventricosum]|nr:hypothetical protein BHM03_00023508 [Ensete ventricosum]
MISRPINLKDLKEKKAHRSERRDQICQTLRSNNFGSQVVSSSWYISSIHHKIRRLGSVAFKFRTIRTGRAGIRIGITHAQLAGDVGVAAVDMKQTATKASDENYCTRTGDGLCFGEDQGGVKLLSPPVSWANGSQSDGRLQVILVKLVLISNA